MRFLSSAAILLWSVGTLFAASDDLLVARRALGDGLWAIAAKHAAEAGRTTNETVRTEARLMELEALAGAARAEDMLGRLETWPESTGDGFRYWKAWANARLGRLPTARGLLAVPFASREYQMLALRLAARVAKQAGDREVALKTFAQVSEACGTNMTVRAENAVEWARALAFFGDAAGAYNTLSREGALESPGEAGCLARLLAAEMAERIGDRAEGRKLLAGLLEGGSNTVERAYVPTACLMADWLLAEGTTNEAFRVLSNAVARAQRPELVRRAGFALGFALLARPESRAEGRAVVSDLVRRFPGEAESGVAQLKMADGLLAAGDAEGAAHAYEVLLQAYPEHMLDAHVLEGRGWAFARLGRSAEAIGSFARAAQVTTNEEVRARCAFKQAEVLATDGRFAEAAKVYESVTVGTLAEQARFRRADALSRAGQADAALASFDKLARAGGAESVEAGLRAASLETRQGRFEDAITLYGTLLDERARPKPTAEQRSRALAGRGRALYGAYRFKEAEADFAAVAKLVPSRRDEMDFLSALCLYGDGRDREARAAAATLLKTVKDPALKWDLRFWIAKCDAAGRDWAQAIAGFEICAADPQTSPAHQMEALVRAARGAAAQPDFPKVVELAGRVATNVLTAAALAKETPQTAWAAEALVLQGEALMELARFDEAILVLERVSHVPASATLLQRAAIARADGLFAMGAGDANRYREALGAYRRILREEELSDSLRIQVAFKEARSLEKLRRLDEAVDKYYQNVVLAYWDGVRPDAGEDARRHWFDGTARGLFARAAFVLADYYESRGEPRQAIHVLDYLIAARVPAATEAKRRIARLKEKGVR